MGQRNSALFYGAIVVAIIAIVLAVYYLIPGPYHVIVTSGNATDAHKTYAIGFGVIAVICIIAAYMSRPRRNV